MRAYRIVVALIPLWLMPAFSWACQLGSLPDIKVTVIPWQVKENYQYSQAELAQLVSRQAWLTAEHVTRGVYEANIMHRKRVTFDSRSINVMGDLCTGIKELTVEVSFSEPTIYLARELAWARCVANATREHEQKHAALDRKLLTEFADTLRRGLNNLTITTQPIPGPTDQAQATWQQIIDAHITDAIAKFTQTRNKAQKAVDSQDEYARLDDACPNN